MKPRIELTRAMTDPALFGNVFASPSFWTWKVVAKLIDGLPLTETRELALFKECTGRSQPPNRQDRRLLRRLILLVGRRGGKDRFLSAVAVWRAALCADWRKHISAGEQAVVILLGRDRKQASILRRYCHGLLQVPLLEREVTRQTDEVIEFRNGSSLEIITNNAALVRGRSAIAVLGSECCHWRTDETAASSDEEVVGAAEPSLSMSPDGGLLLLGSSVFRKRGFMYRQYKKLHGSNDTDDICWFAPSIVMNPKLPSSVVEKAMLDDTFKAGAEYRNLWREDLSDLIPADAVEGSTDFSIKERPPLATVNTYVAHVDAAGGTGSDSFAIAIAHRETSSDRCILDLCRERIPRFVPSEVIAEYATLLKSYRVSTVSGDAFGGGLVSDEFRRHNILFKASSHTTSENYLRALPLLLNGRARLLDLPKLRAQLISLERHVQPSGHEVVRHPAVSSAHDDLSCAACGALVQAASANSVYRDYAKWVGPPADDPYGIESYQRLRRNLYYMSLGTIRL
jgi:hypothetical protein